MPFHFLPATDTWPEQIDMNDIRFRPSCAFSSDYGLIVSGGLYQYIDTVEYTSGGSYRVLHLTSIV